MVKSCLFSLRRIKNNLATDGIEQMIRRMMAKLSSGRDATKPFEANQFVETYRLFRSLLSVRHHCSKHWVRPTPLAQESFETKKVESKRKYATNSLFILLAKIRMTDVFVCCVPHSFSRFGKNRKSSTNHTTHTTYSFVVNVAMQMGRVTLASVNIARVCVCVRVSCGAPVCVWRVFSARNMPPVQVWVIRTHGVHSIIV